MSDSRVNFVGPGPFHLPAAQRATAISIGGAVEARLYAIIPIDDDSIMRPMVIQMTASVAQNFAAQLLDAAAKVLH
jgi:hypothetical protein